MTHITLVSSYHGRQHTSLCDETCGGDPESAAFSLAVY